MNRYLNVAVVDARGSVATIQIMCNTLEGLAPALEWIEAKQQLAAVTSPTRCPPPVAAFIFDTNTETLFKYSIDGLRARLVK